VAARFQIDVERGATSGFARGLKGDDFRMAYAVVGVEALAYDDPILHNDGTHQRVWLYLTFAFGRECQSQIQKQRSRSPADSAFVRGKVSIKLLTMIVQPSDCHQLSAPFIDPMRNFSKHIGTGEVTNLNTDIDCLTCGSTNEPSVVARVEA
jgi:hypothetical protein